MPAGILRSCASNAAVADKRAAESALAAAPDQTGIGRAELEA
jgi:hypothetical protein